MKLYYTPGACSLSVHIVARELGVELDLIRVDPMTKRTEFGADYTAVNPNGYVPALQLPDGSILTEVSAILQLIADSKPESGIIPLPSSKERYSTLQWLSFIATELHKGYSVLFHPDVNGSERSRASSQLHSRLKHVEATLKKRRYLASEAFTIVDAYAWVVLNWSRYVGLDLKAYLAIDNYLTRIAGRRSVQIALVQEGLLHPT